MRASVSLTSIFSSLRSPTVSSHLLIPIIRIISPTEPPPPRLSTGPGIIRRWRGALGTLGDLTLQLPSQGITSGARLALARQGCATGSFRLNCAESLYVKDERGLAMFQRIQLEEELEKGRLGLRERPPMLVSASRDTDELTRSKDSSSNKSTEADQTSRKTRRPSVRTQRRNVLAAQGFHFDSGGLSSCATFTEGLCHLEDYVRGGASEAPAESSSTDVLPTVHSEEDISQLSASDETPNLSWLDSLRRKAFSNGDRHGPSVVKKRRPAEELVKSFSCIDLDISFPELDLTLNIDPSLSTSDGGSGQMMEVPLKSTNCRFEEVSDGPKPKLRREGSWARLRRRISKRFSMQYSDLSKELQNLDESASVSIAAGLMNILQQGVPTNLIQPSIHVLS